jgi:heme exporter protein A
MPPIEAVSRFAADASKVGHRRAAMRLIGEGLACHRGGRDVFAGVSFSVGAGQALIVSGPNGAGKTSLLRIVAGLLSAAGGRIALENADAERTVGEQAHLVAHQDAFKLSLSVRENLQFWAAYLGGGGMGVSAALAAVDLDGLADLPAGYLSAGQRRRLSLARLLAADRPVWLLDEPTAALDSSGTARLAELMQAHLGGGGIILAATHGPLGLEPAAELKLGGPRR